MRKGETVVVVVGTNDRMLFFISKLETIDSQSYVQYNLIKNLKISEKNLIKRFEEDLNNLMYHSSYDIKSRVEKYNALNKRVKRFQR